MKRTALTVTFLTLFATLFSLPAGAQLKYRAGESLSMGVDFPDPNYGITAGGYQLLQIYGPGSMFYANTNHTMCYLRGTGWNVLFFNRQNKKYNDVRAGYVLTFAHGEIYDTWVAPAYTSSVLKSLRLVSLAAPASASLATRMMAEEAETTGYGFVASEVEEVLPKAVIVDDEGNKLINYSVFLPLATRSISNIYQKIRENSEKLSRLESQTE